MFTIKNPLSMFLILYLLLACTISHASNDDKSNNRSINNNKQYLLQKIAQAPLSKTKKHNWLALLEQPKYSQYYYLANQEGKIYQLQPDEADNTQLLLDLSTSLLKKSIIKLTAFTLHPNFSLREHPGYGTFYTAHVEKSTTNKTERLHEAKIKTSQPYDAVLTEWQLNAIGKIDLSKQREILRIAIPSASNNIKQLSFNPNSTSWDDNFSQLYIALMQSPGLKHYPLYSGVILRIHPDRTEATSYTVPDDNPFFSNAEIDKSIYLLGAGQIKHFIWPEKHAHKLLLSHQFTLNKIKTHGLSYADGGEDWRDYSPQQFLHQSEQPLTSNNLLAYREGNAPALRNKLLLLTQNSRQWQLSSLNTLNSSPEFPLTKQKKAQPLLQQEWQFQQHELIAQQLILTNGNRGELLVFNNDSGAIYQLFQKDRITLNWQDDSHHNQVITQSGATGIIFILCILIGLLGGYIFYQIKVQNISAKSLVRREFAKLALTDDKFALNLFRRNQKQVEANITLHDIRQCQLLIGDIVIATINNTVAHGFNDSNEQDLREIFQNEQVAKMVDGKVRRIGLIIHTSEKDKYVICLYLRKGSDRITKQSYFEVVDDVIDWCWFFAKKLNSEHTGKRIFRAKLTAADIAKAEHKANDVTPLHTQAANIRPAIKPKINIAADEAEQGVEITPCEESIIGFTLDNRHNSTEVGSEQVNSETLTSDTQDADNIESGKVETDLVHNLEKVVELHQQGFLTAEEFEQAKATLFARPNIIEN